MTLIPEQSKRHANFPELTIIEESNKEGKNDGSNNYSANNMKVPTSATFHQLPIN
jgi:hypothetical protein